VEQKVRITIEAPDQELEATLGILEANGINWVDITKRRAHKTDKRTSELVYALYKSGLAVRDISRRTSVSRSTVSKIVRNPADYGLKKKALGRQGVSEEQQ